MSEEEAVSNVDLPIRILVLVATLRMQSSNVEYRTVVQQEGIDEYDT